MDDVCMTPHFGSLFPPTVNYQVVLTDILIELTKFNNFLAIGHRLAKSKSVETISDSKSRQFRLSTSASRFLSFALALFLLLSFSCFLSSFSCYLSLSFFSFLFLFPLSLSSFCR